MNLVRVFFEHRNPILDIGRAALRVMPHAHALPRHHGADLGPQFLAGVLRRSKAFIQPILERVAVHAVRVPGRVTAFMQRRLVVAVARRELGRLREHHLVLGDPVIGPISGDVLDPRPAGLNHLLRIAVGVPFRPRLCRSRFQLQSIGLLDVEHGVLFTDGMGTLLFLVDRLAVLVLEHLALLVLCGSCRPIREKQDLRPFLAFANLPARFLIWL